MKIVNGRLSEAHQVESPNQDERPTADVSLIVIHNISLPAGHFGNCYIEQFFCNCLPIGEHADFADLEGVKVSSHLLVRRDGSIVQFVPFDRRAWHAGASCYGERDNCNDFSVGIEVEGTDDSGYCDCQYSTLADICRTLMTTYGISSADIVGHSDIAPGRKTDPGPSFEWERLRALVG